MRTHALFQFVLARHEIAVARAEGKPKPWTDDAILRRFRFCNVYRELDTVTKWIAENWRTPYENDKNVWFAMVMARLVNWPETMAELTPLPWNPQKFLKVLQGRKKAKKQVFNSAYIVSTNGRAMDKAEYLAQHVLHPLWEERRRFHATSMDLGTLEELYAELRDFQGLGSFMAAQVVADVKFTPRYAEAPDFWTFAASGPGSRRGMNRVMELPFKQGWREIDWITKLIELQSEIDPMARVAHLPRISAQDLQNCLCEFDKYERVRLGEGYPRNTYNGG